MVRAGKVSRKATSSSKKTASAQNDVPDVYRDMLADTISPSPAQINEGGRAVKRRRVGGRIVEQSHDHDAESPSHISDIKLAFDSDIDDLFEDVKPNRQHIVQSDSEDSAGSDLNWEEVGLDANEERDASDRDEDAGDGQISIVLGDHGDEQHSRVPERLKRKPMTAEDKALRLAIHKMHLSSLLAHVHLRSHWCNDEEVYVGVRDCTPI